MIYFSSILFCLLSWWFPPPEPTFYASYHQGLFPHYGFEEDWNQECALSVKNFVKSGVLKIDEEEISFSKNRIDTLRSFFDIHVSSEGDSVYVCKFTSTESRDTQIFLKNGKSVYYSGNVKKKYPSEDTQIFNAAGKIIEEDYFDSYRKIIIKTIYDYSSDLNETRTYELIKPEHPKFPFYIKWGKDSIGKARKDSARRVYDNASDKWDQAYKSMKDEYTLLSKVVTKIDSFKRTEEEYNYNYSDSLPSSHRIKYYDSSHRQILLEDIDRDRKIISVETAEFKDDRQGKVLSKKVILDGKIKYKDEWTYDRSGRCISRTGLAGEEKWKYDSKGNMIEDKSSSQGKADVIIIYKIFYK